MYYKTGSPKNRNSLEFGQKIKPWMEYSVIWIKLYRNFL